MVEVLEHCRVAPAPGTVAKTSIPLTYFDLFVFSFIPVQHLFFFDFPHSKTHFLQNVIPNLKASLSIALHHFFPLAGKLILPTHKSTKPEIQYDGKDSWVHLTFAESGKDFNNLAGDHPRNANEFYDLLPEIPKPTKVFDEENSHVADSVPLIAIQVTLFPDAGVCFGLTYEHKAIDGRSFLHFFRTWASLAKLQGGEDANFCLPSYDRSVLHHPDGRLENIFLSQIKNVSLEHLKMNEHLATKRVRATFVLTGDNIRRLKKLVMARRPELPHVSTFTVACAYSWVCKVKSGDEDDEDEIEYFGFVADCRGRTDPLIPANYFGNCLTVCLEGTKRGVLVGEEGFVIAVELIGETIEKRMKKRSQEGLMEGNETLFSKWLPAVNWDRVLTVAGSPKMAVYDLDFGFGKPKKREIVSIDGTGAISLTESKNSKGGVEIGVSLPMDQMKVFADMFVHHLQTIID